MYAVTGEFFMEKHIAKKKPALGVKSAKDLANRIKSLENSLEITEEYTEKLEAKVRSLEKQKKMLYEEEKKKNDGQRKKVLEGKEVALRDSLIKNLSAEISVLKKRFSKVDELEMIGNDGCVPVIPVEDFDKDKILDKDRRFGINGAVVFFERTSKNDISTVKILLTLQPKAVIANLDESAANMLRNADICVINPKGIYLRKYFDFLGADRAELEREIKKSGDEFS